MKQETISYLKANLDLDKNQIKEIRMNMIKETDFEVDDFRFIHEDEIDEVMQDELSSDTYVLGSFSAWFIADVLPNMPSEAVKALQEADKFEVLGELMLEHIETVQEEYASIDGYGHHFAHYDHETHEFENWYAFRVN